MKFKDGRIGLFDTKEGMTAKDAKAKAEALQRYMKEQNEKGKNLVGGIITVKRSNNKAAIGNNDKVLYLNDSDVYEYDENLSGWKVLEL
ncbi:MAG: hypothetical protein QXT20_00090 [Candidatus Woesearchaeota archaeon]